MRIPCVILGSILLASCGREGRSSYASPDEPLAEGVAISGLWFNQGASHVLRDLRYGKPFGQPAVVQDRAGLLTVGLDVEPDWEPRDLVAVLQFDGVRGIRREVHDLYVEADGFQGFPDDTFDFDVPAHLVAEASHFTVTLHEYDPDDRVETDNPDARFDLRDEPWTVRETGSITVRLIPVQYDADGSGRVPDTSPAQLQEYEQALRGMYPVTDVRIEVGDTLPWGSVLQPSGAGWSTLLTRMSDLRASESLHPNTYFYALFEPASTEEAFCGMGCVLGLSPVGTLQDASTRASIGLGYTGRLSADTMVHEIGHAHGREHAPCGQGVASIDPAFPHSGARLGTWGWNITTGELYDPNQTTDMMGYCSPIWVSNYTWFHLSDRVRSLEQQGESFERSTPREYRRFAVETDGSVVPVGPARLLPRSGAPLRTVQLDDARGAREIGAHWVPFVDLPAVDGVQPGMLLVESGADWDPDSRLALVPGPRD
ncbi:MAG: M66 family metalloprotease [Myxococcota bacterium]